MQTFTCPSGQAFNHQSSSCEDASTVNCYETMDHHSHHHHHKRAIETYHTIDIQELKTKVVDAYYTIRPIVKKTLEEIAPTIYAKFEESYLPAIRETKEKVLPFLREKVYPQARKWLKYSVSLIGKVIEKLYQSYKLSNSTQITIVSVSDIVEEVSNDLQPVIRFGKYLSDTMNGGQSRHKREVSDETEADYQSTVEFIMNAVQSLMSESFFGQQNAFIDRLVIPSFYEMMSNEETKYDVLSILLSAKSVFTPVAWEIMNLQAINKDDDTIVKLPKKFYSAAVEQFLDETRPVVLKLVQRHFYKLYHIASENEPLLEKNLEILEARKCPHARELRTAIQEFVAKHGDMLTRPDIDSHVYFYPFSEILEDLEPVKNALFKVFKEYFKDNESSWLKYLFGSITTLKKDESIKPLPKVISKKIIY